MGQEEKGILILGQTLIMHITSQSNYLLSQIQYLNNNNNNLVLNAFSVGFLDFPTL